MHVHAYEGLAVCGGVYEIILVHVRACVFACVRACVRACAECSRHTLLATQVFLLHRKTNVSGKMSAAAHNMSLPAISPSGLTSGRSRALPPALMGTGSGSKLCLRRTKFFS